MKLTVAFCRSAMKYVTSINASMVPLVKSDTMRIAVASAMPSVVKAARIGWRVILRNVITVGWDNDADQSLA